jgi:hypothetical protein
MLINSSGSITVTFGVFQIWIYTQQTPQLVLLNVIPGDQPTCGFQVDVVSSEIGENGFTIFAGIGSNSAQIDWICE